MPDPRNTDISQEDQPQNPEAAPKQEKQELKREIIDFAKLVVWFLVIFVGLRTYVIEGYEVQGPSMIPTLEDNERILVLKLPHVLSKIPILGGYNALKPGDIVVFDSPDNPRKRYVKRVIAKGPAGTKGKTVDAESQRDPVDSADTVRVEFLEGQVYVNNHRLEEDYLTPSARISNDRQKLLLHPGDYYVLGDNRSVSKDSRSFNAIQEDRMIGKAILRFWPPRRISLLH